MPSLANEPTSLGRGEGSAQAMLGLLRKLEKTLVAMEKALAYELENDGKLNATDFTRLQQRKSRMAVEVQDVEKALVACAIELGTQWGVSNSPPCLKDLANCAAAENADAFLPLHQKLRQQAQDIQRMAAHTARNAKARLQAMDATLHVICEAAKLHTTYSGAGRLAQRTMHFTSKSV